MDVKFAVVPKEEKTLSNYANDVVLKPQFTSQSPRPPVHTKNAQSVSPHSGGGVQVIQSHAVPENRVSKDET